MGRLKSILGYVTAVLAFFVVPATFLGLDYFSAKLVSATGIKVSPRFTGGEIAKIIDHKTYKTIIHHPVFDGLTGERENGFIQIRWEAGKGWPETIEERFDYTGDNIDDFSIKIDTKNCKINLKKHNLSVTGIEQTYMLKSGCAVRINLKKQYINF